MLTTYFGGCCSFCAGVRSLFVWCSFRPLVVSVLRPSRPRRRIFAAAGCLCWSLSVAIRRAALIALYNVYIRANTAPPLVSTETEKRREERPQKKFC